MAELPLSVNSTDSALLNGNAASPAVANGVAGDTAVGGGFAAVLGNQLMPGKESGAVESPPAIDKTGSVPVTEGGESPPLSGKALPSVALENEEQTATTYSELDASLLSAIAADNGQPSQTLMVSPLTMASDPALIKQDGLVESMQPQTAMAQAQDKNGAVAQSTAQGASPDSLMNMMTNPQTSVIAEQRMTPALSNTAPDAQQASTLPLVPTMLGKSISTKAEQALARASLNVGKGGFLRTEATSATGPATINAQNNTASSSTVISLHNLMGSTPRTDMFNALMGGSSPTDAQTDLRLPANVAAGTQSSALINTATVPSDAVNPSADLPRLPTVAGNGLSSSLMVSTPVVHPAWSSELGQRVTWLANNQLHEAQLQLHPRSLGAVEVRIAYGHEQQLHVSFTAANPIARDALEASLPRLRDMFEQQGLNLANANISHQSPGQQGHHDNMGNESQLPAGVYASNDELVDVVGDVVGLERPPAQWLGEGMLSAYA